MKFKVDENLPQEASDLLRASGYDAMSVLEQTLGGKPDPQVYAVCQAEGRILITLDLDFANIRAYPPAESAGIVVLRLVRQDKTTVLERTRRLLPILERQSPRRALWLVDERRIRVRNQVPKVRSSGSKNPAGNLLPESRKRISAFCPRNTAPRCYAPLGALRPGQARRGIRAERGRYVTPRSGVTRSNC